MARVFSSFVAFYFPHGMMTALAAILILPILLSTSAAQNPDPLFGIPPFSTITGSQFDTIDLTSSNVILNLPLRNKIGKMPFTSQLAGGGRMYQNPATTSQPLPSWSVDAGDYLSLVGGQGMTLYFYESYTQQCGSQPYDPVYTGFAAIDASGVSHSLQTTPDFWMDEYGCWPTTATLSTSDGSGFTAYLNTTPTGTSTLYDRLGNQTSKSGVFSDPDNVSMSVVIPYGFEYGVPSGSFTDTLGQTVLTSTVSTNSHGVSQVVYGYADVSDNTQYTVTYSDLLWATNFGCSGVTDGTATVTTPWPTQVTTPTGGTYNISYEATPGRSGYITGRIAKITLPMGGYISYTYTGGNNGISCGGSVAPTLTRTVNDGLGHNSVWTYQNSLSVWNSGPFTVSVTDPAGNLTVVTFSGALAASGGFQTESQSYQGSGGTPLVTTVTCYNGNFANCTTTGSGPSSGVVTQTDVFTYLNGSSSASLVETKYDAYGDVTEVASYDFGAATSLPPTRAPSVSPLSATTTVYGTWNGSTCASMSTVNSSIGAYMHAYPCTVTTVNSAGTTVSQKRYTYNSGGHPTQTQTWVSGTTYLISYASYNANGTVATSTDVNGNAVSTYAYNGTDGCNSLLATSVTVTGTNLPSAGLTSSTEWNCSGAVVTQTTDPNQQPTTYTYNDPLWRITSVTDPLTNLTTYSYPSQTTFETVLNFGTTSTSDTLVTWGGWRKPRPTTAMNRTTQFSPTSGSAMTPTGEITNFGSPRRTPAVITTSALRIGQTECSTL